MQRPLADRECWRPSWHSCVLTLFTLLASTGCVVAPQMTECTPREGCAVGEVCVDGQCVSWDTSPESDTGVNKDARVPPDDVESPDTRPLNGRCEDDEDCLKNKICVDAWCIPRNLGELVSANLPDELTQERILDDLVWEDLVCDPDGDGVVKWACAVAFLYISTLGARCTAWLAGPDLLVTNNHCVESDAVATGALAIFNFDRGTPESDWRLFRCDDFVATSRALDLTLLRCEDSPGSTLGWLRADCDERATADEAVTVIHQNCDYVSDSTCSPTKKGSAGSVIDPNAWGTNMSHNADTLGGSSGAPVLRDSSGEVIGIHRGYSGTHNANIAAAASEFDSDDATILRLLCPQPAPDGLGILNGTFLATSHNLTNGWLRIVGARFDAALIGKREPAGQRFRITGASLVYGDGQTQR